MVGSCISARTASPLLIAAGLISTTNLPGRISTASCGKPAQNRANASQHARFCSRREPVVQRKRIALVLDQDARCQRCDFRERAFEVIAQWYGPRLHRRVATRAHFGAMHADGGEPQRRKDQIDVTKRPAADQRQRAAGQSHGDGSESAATQPALRLGAAKARNRGWCRRYRAESRNGANRTQAGSGQRP